MLRALTPDDRVVLQGLRLQRMQTHVLIGNVWVVEMLLDFSEFLLLVLQIRPNGHKVLHTMALIGRDILLERNLYFGRHLDLRAGCWGGRRLGSGSALSHG